MSGERITNREKLKPLGTHTAIGCLNELKKWKDIPYLRENKGMLPPFIIAVGSRVRVKKAPDVLGMKDPVFIDEEAFNKFGLNAYGRVSMLIGTIEHDQLSVPIAVVETQMGCPATQINLKEMLYFARDDGYKNQNGAEIKSDGIYVVRAGTCAGVNSFSPSEVKISIGDLVITNENYGSIGAIIQSTVSALDFVGIKISEKVDALRKILGKHRTIFISHDEQNLRTVCSVRLLLHLQRAADTLGLKNIVGPNFTKDSLYAEIGEEGFAELRNNYGIISTEMEEAVIDVLASEFRREGVEVHSGLISAVIGAIPGKSFPETEEEKRLAHEAENNTLRVAAMAFGEIAKSLNNA